MWDKNEKKAYELYTAGGYDLICYSIEEGKLKCDKWVFCESCEAESPIYKNDCLCCGTPYKESEEK